MFTDILVIGAGIAGLRAALEVPPDLDVLVVTKDDVQQSNSTYAQGGIAGVLSPEDRFENHIEDTLTAGAGLCDRDVVEMVVREAPDQINDLIRWGTHFDEEDGHLALTREGGHSHRRIVHALGDATGYEVMRAIIDRARQAANVTIWDHTFTLDLLTHEGRCVGALVHRPRREHAADLGQADDPGQRRRRHGLPRNDQSAGGHRRRHGGRLPGRRRAARHGVHAVPSHRPLRRRLQPLPHQRGGARRGGLPARQERRPLHARTRTRGPSWRRATWSPRPSSAAWSGRSIPTSTSTCRTSTRHGCGSASPASTRSAASFGLDITRDLIPVRPGAHYMIGGVTVDAQGRTTLPGLWAAGEVTLERPARGQSAGVEQPAGGAGLRRGVRPRRGGGGGADAGHLRGAAAASAASSRTTAEPLDVADITNSLRSLMVRQHGHRPRPRPACARPSDTVAFWCRYVLRARVRRRGRLGAAKPADHRPADDLVGPAARGIARRPLPQRFPAARRRPLAAALVCPVNRPTRRAESSPEGAAV